MNKKFKPWIGVLVSNLLAGLLIWIQMSLPSGGAQTKGYSSYVFTLLPIAMGIILVVFWNGVGLGVGRKLLFVLINILVPILLAVAILKEGAVCVIMVAPLLFGAQLVGVLLGELVMHLKNRFLNVSVAPLLVVLAIADMMSPHHYATQVTDSIVIQATPEKVWQYIPAYPLNTSRWDYWICQFGMPAPILATVDGQSVGSGRKCIFSGNLTFEEKITAIDAPKHLTFDVTKQPDHPELVGHMTLNRGEFILKDNGDGTTTVTGTSWYELHVYPAPYFDMFARDVIRRVHLRVMGHVKRLAEQQSGKAPAVSAAPHDDTVPRTHSRG